MTKVADLVLKTKSGDSYRFGVYPKNTKFRKLPAVYAFVSHGLYGWRILYIGHTVDLSERFDQHHKWNDATRKGFTHIAVCTDVTLLTMDYVEKELIRAWNPPCNEVLYTNE